jgi:hypothetical protein
VKGSAAWLKCSAAILAVAITVFPVPAVAEVGQRLQLRSGDLLDGFSFTEPMVISAWLPVGAAAPPRHRFEGRLLLRARAGPGGFREWLDDYRVTGRDDSVHKHLPEFDFEFLQVGDALVPVRRGAIAGAHPYWEFILGPGRVWQEAGDGDYSRAALPFSLQEVNANCTHNGVLGFLYRQDGSMSRAAFQISSETCAYFKFDMWGLLGAAYLPGEVGRREELARAYEAELASRLPRRPIAALAREFPGVDPAAFGHQDEVSRAHITTWGVIVGGTHYTGDCPTRAGAYPFCEVLHLPSFSVAKSMFAGLALMRLERLYPGARGRIVADYVPECAVGGNWSDVTFENLLDMASGNYLSAEDHADEAAQHADELFFMQRSHAAKIDYACNHFPRRARPGEQWVYHSSDTYLLGAAMSAYVRRRNGAGADILADVVVPDVWRALGFSPTTGNPRRTQDAAAQPFTGFGLTLEPDDVAKLARFLDPDNPLAKQRLDPGLFQAALQQDPADRGLAASADSSLRYNNGFWAFRADGLPGCDEPRFIPFMSGFGGISIVLLPGGVSYYYFSDNHEHRFRRALLEAAKIRGVCERRPNRIPHQRGRPP